MGKVWYAIYVRSRSEKKTAEQMTEDGYEVYIPLQKTLRQWSDRKKMVETPLISCYLFVHISPSEYYEILNYSNVVAYVCFKGKAVPIPDGQILAMQRVVDYEQYYEVANETFVKGDRVEVVAGALKGCEGYYVEEKGKHKFVIVIEAIGYSLNVNIPKSCVKKI